MRQSILFFSSLKVHAEGGCTWALRWCLTIQYPQSTWPILRLKGALHNWRAYPCSPLLKYRFWGNQNWSTLDISLAISFQIFWRYTPLVSNLSTPPPVIFFFGGGSSEEIVNCFTESLYYDSYDALFQFGSRVLLDIRLRCVMGVVGHWHICTKCTVFENVFRCSIKE